MKRMTILALTSAAWLITGCMSQNSKPQGETETTVAPTPAPVSQPAPAAVAASTTISAKAIRVQQSTPYANNGTNDPAVMRECTINTQLPEFIREYAATKGLDVALIPEINAKAKGKNLVIDFTTTRSGGNAFIGHYKYTQIKAVLYENGKQIADLTAARRSGGGAFAGFKGSCSVMGRTVKALGNDVAVWLQNPMPGMRMGDI